MSTTTRVMQGPAILAQLHAAGLAEAHAVIRNRRTGQYTVKFSDPQHNSMYTRGLPPVRELAERIQEALPLADIVDAGESRADWRPHNPALYATVIFNLPAAVQTKSA